MKVGFLIACKAELEAHLKYFDKIKTITYGEMVFYKGKFKNYTIMLCKSGPCEINAGIYLQKMIDVFKPELVINSGTCGTLDTNDKVFDTYIIEKATFWDISTGLIYPSTYICNEKIKDFAISLDKSLKIGNLATGNSFIKTQAQKNRLIKKYGANCCDMEGVAVVYTCQKNKIPCLLLKTVSDNGNEEEFDKNVCKASEKVASVAFKIVENISKKCLK